MNTNIPEITFSREPWDKDPQWQKVTLSDFISGRMDPADERGYGSERLGQFEMMERSIERTQDFCSQMTALLISKGLIEFAEVFAIVGTKYGYQFDGKEQP